MLIGSEKVYIAWNGTDLSLRHENILYLIILIRKGI